MVEGRTRVHDGKPISLKIYPSRNEDIVRFQEFCAATIERASTQTLLLKVVELINASSPDSLACPKPGSYPESFCFENSAFGRAMRKVVEMLTCAHCNAFVARTCPPPTVFAQKVQCQPRVDGSGILGRPEPRQLSRRFTEVNSA